MDILTDVRFLYSMALALFVLLFGIVLIGLSQYWELIKDWRCWRPIKKVVNFITTK